MKEVAFIDFRPEEYDRLLRTGFVRIDDPVRGEIEVRLLFDELHPGIERKQVRVKVIRSGEAAQRKVRE